MEGRMQVSYPLSPSHQPCGPQEPLSHPTGITGWFSVAAFSRENEQLGNPCHVYSLCQVWKCQWFSKSWQRTQDTFAFLECPLDVLHQKCLCFPVHTEKMLTGQSWNAICLFLWGLVLQGSGIALERCSVIWTTLGLFLQTSVEGTCLAVLSKWIERFSTCVDRKAKGQLPVVLGASVGSHNQRTRAEGGSSNVRTRKLCAWTLKAYWWARVDHTNPSWHKWRDGRGLESDQEWVWVLASILKVVSIVVCKLLECNLDKENNLLASKGNYGF